MMTDYYNDRSGCYNDRSGRYRVWIARYCDGTPQTCRDVPPDPLALEPAEEGTMSARQAARYVEAFNRAARVRRLRILAVAIPVTVSYDGEPRPGQSLADTGIGRPQPSPPTAGCQGLGQSPQRSRYSR